MTAAAHGVVMGGQGPWLVMCHGMALAHRDLIGLAKARVAAGWRVLLWDMPGHGGRAPPTDWSVAAMASALEELLDLHAIASFALLGFSFGGMVAQEAIARRPGAVMAFAAYGCFAPRLTGPLVPPRLANSFATALYGWRNWAAIRRRFARACATSEAGQEAVETAMTPLGKRGFLAMTAALLAGVPRDPDFRIDCPLLAVRGANDSNAVTLARAEAALLEAAKGSAERRVVADAGHCAHLDAPDAAEIAIGGFLDRYL